MKAVVPLALSFAASVGALSLEPSPVTKVVRLLQSLRNSVTEDGRAEQRVYDKYKCWCDWTGKRKEDAIQKAKDDMETMGKLIEELKSEIKELDAEMEQLVEDMKTNKEERETAIGIRTKERKAYMAESGEEKQAIGATQKALEVLKGAAALIQQGDKSSVAQSVSAVKELVRAMPSNAAVPPKHLALLSDFVATGKFEPMSQTIVEILKQTSDTLLEGFDKTNKDEAEKVKIFDELIGTKTEEYNQMEASHAKKTARKADAESEQAATEERFDDTKRQKKADEEFLKEMKKTCNEKEEQWNKRQKLRAEELKGIEKALEILSGDEARALFASAIKPGQTGSGASFLQIRSDDAQNRAYDAIVAKAKESHSLRLGLIAMQLQHTKKNHFKEVIGKIDAVVKTLKEEEQDDIDKRDQCKEEYTKIASKVQKLEWKLKKNNAKINKLESSIDKRTKEKEDTADQLKETKGQIEDLRGQRKLEKEDFEHGKEEDEAAIELLKKATEALSSYSKNNGVEMGELQGVALAAVGKNKGDPLTDPDKAPDANFADKDSNKGATKSIVSLMTMITEDLENEVANSIKDEKAAIEKFKKMLKELKDLQTDLEEKIANLKKRLSNLESDKTDENDDKDSNQDDLDDENEYKAKITPDCDWIIKAYPDRHKAREAEKDGLTTAKEILSGAALIEKNKSGFLGR